MSILRLWIKNLPFYSIWFLFFVYFILNCVTNNVNNNRSKEQLESLIEFLGTRNIKPCTPIGHSFEGPAPVRLAQIVSDGEQGALILESIFRDTVKTIWQPLDSSNFPSSKSFAIGLKNQPFVTNFQFFPSKKTTWATYRFKVAGREIYKGGVERIQEGGFLKFELPNLSEDSVQQIWLVPLSDGLGAHVITRSNSTLDSGDDGETSLLTWFTIQGDQGKITKMSETLISLHDFLPQTFLKTSNIREDPIAIGTAVLGREHIIKLARPFQRGQPQVILHSDANPISSLVSFENDDNAGRIHLSWLREAPNSVYPNIVLTEFSIQRLNQEVSFRNFKGFRETQQLRPLKQNAQVNTKMQTIVIKTPHLPDNLKFRNTFHSGSRSRGLMLTWHASLENDFAYIQMPIGTQNPNLLAQSQAVFSPLMGTKLLGSGYLPKGEFAFVTTNNSSTQDLQKPSQIQLCSFQDKIMK